MKIALLGYGKMGKTIDRMALERGHDIVLKIEKKEDLSLISRADIAIDFSVPSAAFENISAALTNGVCIISGTTGWLDKYTKVVELCKKHKGKFIYASNFSLGVNLFFNLNEQLAKLMSNFEEYKVQLDEIHHTQKLDAPSGTAITLAEQIIANSPYQNWIHSNENPKRNELPIYAERIEDVKGIHHVSYISAIDEIKISHTAHTRDGFALGAIIAAEWLYEQQNTGVYTMKDVLSQLMA